MEVQNEIIGLVKDCLKVEQVNFESTPEDIENWDSLNHAVIIDKVEKHFKIKIELMEMLEIENVQDIINLVENKIA